MSSYGNYGNYEISNGETGGFTMIRFNDRKDYNIDKNIENNIDINITEPEHKNIIMALNNR